MPEGLSGTGSAARQAVPAAGRHRAAQARRAFWLWGEVTLAGVVVVVGLTVWHLRRRLRLLHDRAEPPRRVEWPDLDGEGGRTTP